MKIEFKQCLFCKKEYPKEDMNVMSMSRDHLTIAYVCDKCYKKETEEAQKQARELLKWMNSKN